MSFRATRVARIARRCDRHETFQACGQDGPRSPPTPAAAAGKARMTCGRIRRGVDEHMEDTVQENRGFASMDPNEQREIASKGDKGSNAKGKRRVVEERWRAVVEKLYQESDRPTARPTT